MARYKRKIDGNHTHISHQLGALGINVMDTHTLGGGFPDGVAGVGGLNFLLEIKAAEGMKLSPAERDWHATHGGRVLVGASASSLLQKMIDSVDELSIELPNIRAELVDALDELRFQEEHST